MKKFKNKIKDGLFNEVVRRQRISVNLIAFCSNLLFAEHVMVREERLAKKEKVFKGINKA